MVFVTKHDAGTARLCGVKMNRSRFCIGLRQRQRMKSRLRRVRRVVNHYDTEQGHSRKKIHDRKMNAIQMMLHDEDQHGGKKSIRSRMNVRFPYSCAILSERGMNEIGY